MAWTIPWSSSYSLAVEVAWGADLTDSAGSGWTWTDITSDVRTEAGIEIQNGRQDEQSVSGPASCQVVLSNPDGRYLTGPGPNYPNVRRNVPMRVRLNSTVLFQGYATSWTPTFTPGGDNLTVALTANGVLRRLNQGKGTERSAMTRYLPTRSDLVEWWPLETTSSTSVLGLSGVDGGPGMVYQAGSTGAAKVSASDDAPSGAAGSVELTQGGAMVAPIRYQSLGTSWAVGFSMLFDHAVDGDRFVRIDMLGSAGAYINIRLFTLNGGDPGAQITAYSGNVPAGEQWLGFQGIGYRDWTAGGTRWYHFILSTDGTTVYFGGLPDPLDTARTIYLQNYTLTASAVPRTRPTAITLGSIAGNDVKVNYSQVYVTSSYTSAGMGLTYPPQAGYAGEPASARVQRVTAEEDIAVTVIGGTSTTGSPPMGAQPVSTALDILREAEQVEAGFLYDGLGPGLTWVPKREFENTTVDLTVAATQVVEPFGPVDDDQRLRNRVTASRPQGSEVTFEDVTGPAGINAVGVYDDSVEVNAPSDGDALAYAQWRVYLGTQTGYRWPEIGLDYRATPTLLANLPAPLTPGNRITITNPGAVLPGVSTGDLLLHIEGVKLTITPGSWRSELACSPAAPWNVAAIPSETGYTGTDAARATSDGSTLATARTPGQTSLSVTTPSGPRWTTTADDFPMWLDVGGNPVRATACTGTGTTQTFTCDALTVSIPAGAAVDLWRQAVLAL
ncbi:hypothetical protein GCM10010472_10880 [Pseudonocardia halophobica]|uniref:Uncharacterized protein n=1 Tax=Pseudonocardia halophobica TaxID=29401 RepID=A0A9W6L7G4_9PSEU|nr:hypothetical protein [Pseudonocardia halophobica]GLL13475.1 hypothetical protein GCM10017577_46190 [Pseudonocardia halophobica]